MEASALQAPARLTGISLSAPLLRLRSDDQLVALFRAGSEEAFRVIHDRYRQRLFAYVRQMLSGSRPDADDALQDVFMRAHAALRASDQPISLRAWLYRVAHNRCIDQLRRPPVIPVELVEPTRSDIPDPLAEIERREDLRRLVTDVRRLPSQQRSVLLMRELEGASYSDLADAHGITIAAVKSLLVRARIGLVRAAEARDVACIEIRHDLAAAHDRGVRATGRARRHLRDCDGCRSYRTQLRDSRRALAGMAPSGPFPVLAKMLGLGAGSGGAAAGSGAAAGGGAAVGGGAVLGGATVCKVAAVVCSTVVAAGGAAEVQDKLGDRAGGGSEPASAVASQQSVGSTSGAAAALPQSPRERAASADQKPAPGLGKKKAASTQRPAPAAVVAPDVTQTIAEDPAPDPVQSVDETAATVEETAAGPTAPLQSGNQGTSNQGSPTSGSPTQGTPGSTQGGTTTPAPQQPQPIAPSSGAPRSR